MPQVLDPYFHQSVVLLVHHDDEGSLGFIVNRPIELKVADILQGMEIQWQGVPEAPAFFGGPVQPQIGSVLYCPAPEESTLEGATAIAPTIHLTQNLADLSRLARSPPASIRLLLGYAGWGEGQLIDEILRSDWLTAPADEDLLFGDGSEELWQRALISVGVDLASLPSWTPAGDDAN